MPRSRKSKKHEPLVAVLNRLWEESKLWRIEGWKEERGQKFKISLDFDGPTTNVTSGSDTLPSRELVGMKWRAGIVPARNEDQVKNEIESAFDKAGNRVVALALDTNAVLNHFYPNYMEAYHAGAYERKPHLLLLSAGIDHELHYMMSSTLEEGKFFQAIMTLHGNEPSPYKILTNRHAPPTDDRQDPLLRIASKQGRLGIKGLREVRRLQENHTVVVSRPSHIYYSQQIQIEGRFIDAVFDSLIRYEAQFFEKNTNAEVVFLTSDKHQHQTATNEGFKSIYVAPPVKESVIPIGRFRLSFIQRFLEELLVYSPYLKVESGEQNAYLASSWVGMGPEECRLGRIRLLEHGNISVLECG